MAEFFPNMTKMKFEEPESKNPLAFKHCDVRVRVPGKTTTENPQLAAAFWHTFLCYNTKDRTEVTKIAEELRSNGLTPWLDVWELRPGALWLRVVETQITAIGSAAVFVGKNGIGPWQREEIYSLLGEFVSRGCIVIPVLLSNAPRKPRLPILLGNREWVDFRNTEPHPMAQLIWGITGIKPNE